MIFWFYLPSRWNWTYVLALRMDSSFFFGSYGIGSVSFDGYFHNGSDFGWFFLVGCKLSFLLVLCLGWFLLLIACLLSCMWCTIFASLILWFLSPNYELVNSTYGSSYYGSELHSTCLLMDGVVPIVYRMMFRDTCYLHMIWYYNNINNNNPVYSHEWSLGRVGCMQPYPYPGRAEKMFPIDPQLRKGGRSTESK